MTKPAQEPFEAPSEVDTLLGAAPRHVMRHWLSLLVLSIAALGAVIFFIRFVNGDESPYYTAPVEQRDFVPMISERGQIHGAGEETISSLVAGRILWVSGKSDSEVTKGEVLARVDTGPIKNALDISASRLSAAEATLSSATIAAQTSATQLARFEAVWKRSNGRVPALNELETARTQSRQAELAITAAKAEVEAAKLEQQSNRQLLSAGEIRAPISGIIVTRHVQAQEMVREHQPLFTLAARTSPLTVDVPLTPRPGVKIQAGAIAHVRIDSIPDLPQSAVLTLMRTTPPPQSIPPRAVFTIKDPDPKVRPGMMATVEIELPTRQNVMLVPNSALVFRPTTKITNTRPRIYVLDNGEPKRVYVTIGSSNGKHTEVFAKDLKSGDQAIIGWRDAPN